MAQHLDLARNKNNIFNKAKQGIKLLFWHGIKEISGRQLRANMDLLGGVDQGFSGEVKEALEKGADVNTKDSFTGDTALILAVKNGRTKCCEILLEHGADALLKNRSGNNALMYAMNAAPHLKPSMIALFSGVLLKEILGSDTPRFQSLFGGCSSGGV